MGNELVAIIDDGPDTEHAETAVATVIDTASGVTMIVLPDGPVAPDFMVLEPADDGTLAVTQVLQRETLVVPDTEVTIVRAGGGERGPRGRDGADGAIETFRFDQDVIAQTWVIQHNLGQYPSVSIVIGGLVVEAAVEYVDADLIHVGFSTPQSGSAYLN